MTMIANPSDNEHYTSFRAKAIPEMTTAGLKCVTMGLWNRTSGTSIAEPDNSAYKYQFWSGQPHVAQNVTYISNL